MGRSSSSSCIWNQELRWCLLVIALSTWFSGIAAQNVISVGVDDPGIVYTGAWTEQDNGGHKFAGFLGDGFTFVFQGTGISYVSRHNPNGGVANISVDGQFLATVDESANTNSDDPPQEAILFSQSGFDGSQNHTFQLSWARDGQNGGSYVEAYGLEYVQTGIAPTSLGSSGFSAEPPQTATSTSASATGIQSSTASSSPSPSPSSLPPTSRRSKTSRSALIGGIVGGILGGILAAVLISLLALCFFRRRTARRRQRAIDLERRAQPYTLRTDTADGRRRYDPTSPADSVSPISRKGAMPTLSEEAVNVNDEPYRPMQQTGPALGRYNGGSPPDSSALRGTNEAAGRASTSSDSDSHGHPPSYSQVPPRYAAHRLPRVPVPKI